jgi:hypothetical protein
LRHVNWPEGKISPRRIQIDAGAFSGKVEAGLPLENAPFLLMARGLTAKPAPTFADHVLQFPEQSLRLGINRAAQNGSRTALKMLTFAAMRCSLAPRRSRRVPVLGVHV